MQNQSLIRNKRPPRMRIVHAFFVILLAATCFASDETNTIAISFSVVSPPLFDLDLLDHILSVVLQEFFCDDSNLIMLNQGFESACSPNGIDIQTASFSKTAKDSFTQFIHETDPFRSYLAEETSYVFVSDPYDIDSSTRKTTWSFNYEILQFGLKESEKARRENAIDETLYFENEMQQRLNEGILEGVIEERLTGTGVGLVIAQGFGHNTGTSASTNFKSDHVQYHETSSLVMRYIGFAILLGDIVVTVVLTLLAKRHRLEQDSIEKRRKSLVLSQREEIFTTEQTA